MQAKISSANIYNWRSLKRQFSRQAHRANLKLTPLPGLRAREWEIEPKDKLLSPLPRMSYCGEFGWSAWNLRYRTYGADPKFIPTQRMGRDSGPIQTIPSPGWLVPNLAVYVTRRWAYGTGQTVLRTAAVCIRKKYPITSAETRRLPTT